VIRTPTVFVGQRAKALENANALKNPYYGWAFVCPDTGVVVHGDGVTPGMSTVKTTLPALPLAGAVSYEALHYISCDNGYLYEYDPSTRTILRSFAVGGAGSPFVSVSDNACSTSLVTPILYVLTQGVPGELVIIRLPDGAIFRTELGIGEITTGVISATLAGSSRTTPSQVETPSIEPMGPLECVVTNNRGSVCVVNFTPLDGFNKVAQYDDLIPATCIRLLKPYAYPDIIPPDPIPVPTPYDGSVVFSVRSLVGYSGPCMRVRRSSDNAEKDIYFFKGWLDEGVLLQFVGSGNGFMVAWYNQTPQYGVTKFVQPDATKQPRVVISGALYKVGTAQRPAIKFEGTRWLRTETENVLKGMGYYARTHMQAVVFIDVSTNQEGVVFSQQEALGGYRIPGFSYKYKLPPNPYADNAYASFLHIGDRFNLAIAQTLPPSSINVHRFLAADVSTVRSRLFIDSQSVSGKGGVPGAIPDVARTKHSCVGCQPGGYYISPSSIQEVIAMSQTWSDAETEALKQNQIGTFS